MANSENTKLNELIQILGLDMSRAFDTILREKLLEKIKTIFEEVDGVL